MTVTLPSARRPLPGLPRLALTELVLFTREPMGAIWVVAFPLVLLMILGLVSGSHGSPGLGGLRLIDVYTPIIVALVIAMTALNGVPPVLAGYRERGVLRRMALTPAGPRQVLAAHLVVDAAIAGATSVLLVIEARVAFAVPWPRHAVAFALITVLTLASLLVLGLLIAAVAPTARAASATGGVTFFPLLFFAGLWLPRSQMPAGLRRVSDFTPLGAAVSSLQRTALGVPPQWWELGVLAAYAVVAGIVAARWFRWE